jgi:ArsR family transcriptional regulator
MYLAVSYSLESSMPSRNIPSYRSRSCTPTREIPEAILKDLDARGGMEGLLARIPEDGALHGASRLPQALADPIRLSILSALADQPLCVCVIKVVVGITDSKLSSHLNILKGEGFFSGRQQGTWIIYSLTDRGRRTVRCTECIGAGKGILEQVR